MDTVYNTKRAVTESFNDDGVWQDLIGIAPDPPDRRKKCEKCQ